MKYFRIKVGTADDLYNIEDKFFGILRGITYRYSLYSSPEMLFVYIRDTISSIFPLYPKEPKIIYTPDKQVERALNEFFFNSVYNPFGHGFYSWCRQGPLLHDLLLLGNSFMHFTLEDTNISGMTLKLPHKIQYIHQSSLFKLPFPFKGFSHLQLYLPRTKTSAQGISTQNKLIKKNNVLRISLQPSPINWRLLFMLWEKNTIYPKLLRKLDPSTFGIFEFQWLNFVTTKDFIRKKIQLESAIGKVFNHVNLTVFDNISEFYFFSQFIRHKKFTRKIRNAIVDNINSQLMLQIKIANGLLETPKLELQDSFLSDDELDNLLKRFENDEITYPQFLKNLVDL